MPMTQILRKPDAGQPFSFSEMEDLVQTKLLSVQEACEQTMVLPVNNYLKTPDEIELEFRYGINPRKLNLKKDSLINLTSILKTDGYSNIHEFDTVMSEFMEENY